FFSHSGERPPEPPERLSGLTALGALTASVSGPLLADRRSVRRGRILQSFRGAAPGAPGTALGPASAGRVGGLARAGPVPRDAHVARLLSAPRQRRALTASLAGARYRWAPTSLGLLRAPRRCWVCRRPLLRWRRRAAVTVGRSGARPAVLGVLAALLCAVLSMLRFRG